MSSELESLKALYPLPDGWRQTEVFTETAEASGLRIRLAGLIANKGETTITGSAAHTEDDPLQRAYFELLERVLLIDAMQAERPIAVRDAQGGVEEQLQHSAVFPNSPDPQNWQYSKSNGVALGRNWPDACERAKTELVERDLILRAWYGQLLPQRRQVKWLHSQLLQSYEFELYEVSSGGWFAGIAAGWPKSDDAPLLIGFGARREASAALEAAYAEALQRLGFLWGEEIPTSEPQFEPTPDYHQEYYLWPEKRGVLQRWLGGEHAEFAGLLPQAEPARFRFADLGSSGGLRAVKALSDGCLPVTFGRGGPVVQEIPETLLIHPIP